MIVNVWSTGRHRGGYLHWPSRTVRCALGRGGVTAGKREGDGATPAGRFPLRRVFYRPDRIARPATALPVAALRPRDGWCDAPADPAYNTLIERPFSAPHERLWRTDPLYDVIVAIGCNDDPVVPGLGSAIFLHIARAGYRPTEGCVALAKEDLLALLERCDAETVLAIGVRPSPGPVYSRAPKIAVPTRT